MISYTITFSLSLVWTRALIVPRLCIIIISCGRVYLFKLYIYITSKRARTAHIDACPYSAWCKHQAHTFNQSAHQYIFFAHIWLQKLSYPLSVWVTLSKERINACAPVVIMLAQRLAKQTFWLLVSNCSHGFCQSSYFGRPQADSVIQLGLKIFLPFFNIPDLDFFAGKNAFFITGISQESLFSHVRSNFQLFCTIRQKIIMGIFCAVYQLIRIIIQSLHVGTNWARVKIAPLWNIDFSRCNKHPVWC